MPLGERERAETERETETERESASPIKSPGRDRPSPPGTKEHRPLPGCPNRRLSRSTLLISQTQPTKSIPRRLTPPGLRTLPRASQPPSQPPCQPASQPDGRTGRVCKLSDEVNIEISGLAQDEINGAGQLKSFTGNFVDSAATSSALAGGPSCRSPRARLGMSVPSSGTYQRILPHVLLIRSDQGSGRDGERERPLEAARAIRASEPNA